MRPKDAAAASPRVEDNRDTLDATKYITLENLKQYNEVLKKWMDGRYIQKEEQTNSRTSWKEIFKGE